MASSDALDYCRVAIPLFVAKVEGLGLRVPLLLLGAGLSPLRLSVRRSEDKDHSDREGWKNIVSELPKHCEVDLVADHKRREQQWREQQW